VPEGGASHWLLAPTHNLHIMIDLYQLQGGRWNACIAPSRLLCLVQQTPQWQRCSTQMKGPNLRWRVVAASHNAATVPKEKGGRHCHGASDGPAGTSTEMSMPQSSGKCLRSANVPALLSDFMQPCMCPVYTILT
jgi:hypothetical protein